MPDEIGQPERTENLGDKSEDQQAKDGIKANARVRAIQGSKIESHDQAVLEAELKKYEDPQEPKPAKDENPIDFAKRQQDYDKGPILEEKVNQIPKDFNLQKKSIQGIAEDKGSSS
jgi:hypothetical protein